MVKAKNEELGCLENKYLQPISNLSHTHVWEVISEGVISNRWSCGPDLGGRGYFSSTVQIWWIHMKDWNEDLEEWNDVTKTTIWKDTL